MAFVNERISEEDREKYNLDALWERYGKDSTIKVIGEAARQWTINRGTETFLIHSARVIAEWLEHGPSYTKEHVFVLYSEKEFYEIRLIRVTEEKVFAEKLPRNVLAYSVTWDLKSITPEPSNQRKIKLNIAEALKIFGENGVITKDCPQTHVKCNF